MKENNWTELDKIVASVVGLGKENAIKVADLYQAIDNKLGAGTSDHINIGDYADFAEKGLPVMTFEKTDYTDMVCLISNEAEKEEWLNKIGTTYEEAAATMKLLGGDEYKNFPAFNDLLRLEHAIRKIEV